MNFEEEVSAATQAADTPSKPAEAQPAAEVRRPTKFCSRCGQVVDEKAVICPHCGCQIDQLASAAASPNIVINNSNSSVNSNVNTNQNTVGFDPRALKKPKNKWVAVLLCLFLGFLGAHKFYEGKIGMGVLYLFTGGLFFIGVLVDFFALLFKPNPYYV